MSVRQSPAVYEIRFAGDTAFQIPVNGKEAIPDAFKPRDKIPRAPASSSPVGDRQSEPPKKQSKSVRNSGSLATVAPEPVAVTTKSNQSSQSVSLAEKRDRVSRIPISAARRISDAKRYEPKPLPFKESRPKEVPQKSSPTKDEALRITSPARELPARPLGTFPFGRLDIADEEAFKSRDKITRSPVPSMQMQQKHKSISALASWSSDDDDDDEAAAFKSRDKIARSPVPSMQMQRKHPSISALASLSSDDDEAAAFKSRDKIARSPVPSRRMQRNHPSIRAFAPSSSDDDDEEVSKPEQQDLMGSHNSRLNGVVQDDPMMLDTSDDELPPSKPNARVNNIGRATKKKRSYSSGGSSSETETMDQRQTQSVTQQLKKQKPENNLDSTVGLSTPPATPRALSPMEQMDIETTSEPPSLTEEERPPRWNTEPSTTPTSVEDDVAEERRPSRRKTESPTALTSATGDVAEERQSPPRRNTESPTTPKSVAGDVAEEQRPPPRRNTEPSTRPTSFVGDEEEPPVPPRRILNPDEMVIPTLAKKMRKNHATNDGYSTPPVKAMGAYTDVTDEVIPLFDPPPPPSSRTRPRAPSSGGRSRQNSLSAKHANSKIPTRRPVQRIPSSNIIDLNSTPMSKPRAQQTPSGEDENARPERRPRREEWVMLVKDDDSSSTSSARRSEELAKLNADSRHARDPSKHAGHEAQHKTERDSLDNNPKIVIQSPSSEHPITLDLERTNTSLSAKENGKKNKRDKKKKKADKKNKKDKKAAAGDQSDDEEYVKKSCKWCCTIQ